jgi:HPr kinase/phosphorylase
MSAPAAVHASCIVVGESGVLIRGGSGSGKSTLARRVVDEAARQGRFARLVADDRVLLAAAGGRLVARPHPAIAGRIEVRGAGLMDAGHEGAVVIRLVVDCGDTRLDRLPSDDQLSAQVAGVRLARIAIGPDQADRVLLALETARSLPDGPEGTTQGGSAF